MSQAPETPSADDLRAVAEFAVAFDSPDFVAGEWVKPETRDDGVIVLGWRNSSETVGKWEQALYDHHIVDSESGHMASENVEYVNKAITNPDLLRDADLGRISTVLTFLMRAEHHTGGGWYEEAFASGMAQAATRRLGELGEGDSAGGNE
jgi:hypothetical protein